MFIFAIFVELYNLPHPLLPYLCSFRASWSGISLAGIVSTEWKLVLLLLKNPALYQIQANFPVLTA